MSLQEQTLPGVILASDPKIFQRLEQICCLGDVPVGGGDQLECGLRSKLIRGVRSVLLLVPTDPRVRSSLEGFSLHSPKGASDDTHTPLPPDAILKDYLDASHISPYQLLYNMEVWVCGISWGCDMSWVCGMSWGVACPGGVTCPGGVVKFCCLSLGTKQPSHASGFQGNG